jgi:hypothetical protein
MRNVKTTIIIGYITAKKLLMKMAINFQMIMGLIESRVCGRCLKGIFIHIVQLEAPHFKDSLMRHVGG